MFATLLAFVVPFLASAALAAPTGVSIVGFAYSPTPVTVAAGTTVVWTNNDQAPHSVTADGGTFDSSPSNCDVSGGAGCIAPGATFSHTFSTPGTFTYFCVVHTFMHGTVVVTAATTTTTKPAHGTTTTTVAATTTTVPVTTTVTTGTTTTVAPTSTTVAATTTTTRATIPPAKPPTPVTGQGALAFTGSRSGSLTLLAFALGALGCLALLLARLRIPRRAMVRLRK